MFTQSSNFNVQISNKSQISKFKVFGCLFFDFSLIFDVWCLMFKRQKGASCG